MGTRLVCAILVAAFCSSACSSKRQEFDGDAGPDAAMPVEDATVPTDDAAADGVDGVDASFAQSDASTAGDAGCTGPENGRLIVLSQDELEAVRGCQKFNGDLIIAGPEITDLSPLESLEVVTGRLAIGTRFRHWRISAQLLAIESLAALSKLRSADTLELSALPIRDLGDLEALTDLRLLLLEKLDGLDDLTGLERVGWTELAINECANLQTLEGLTVQPTVDSIGLSKNPQLVDLGVLQTVRTVREVYFRELPVRDLSGLSGLRSVTELLNLSSCYELFDLTGLNTLATSGTIVLVTNPQLRSTLGLRLSGNPAITLYENENLEELVIGAEDGLKGIRTLESIRQPKLISLHGLREVERIDTLSISGADGLTDLTGLEGLTQANQIALSSNRSLTSLKGLDRVRSKLASFSLFENSSLESLRSLAAVPGADAVSITRNVLLPECEVTWLSDRWDVPIESYGNGDDGTCSD